MGAPGQPKTGGRKKGVPNRKTQTLKEKAQELGVDPFLILLHFAAGNWKQLGYPSETCLKLSRSGDAVSEYVIEPELRVTAAKEACQYLEPKRKAIEITNEDKNDRLVFRVKWADEDEGSGSSDAEENSASEENQ